MHIVIQYQPQLQLEIRFGDKFIWNLYQKGIVVVSPSDDSETDWGRNPGDDSSMLIPP